MDWDALSAVGTVLAVFVALGLASQAERQRARSERQRAGLVAARLLETVRHMADKTHHHMAMLAFYEDNRDWTKDDFLSDLTDMGQMLEGIGISTIQALEPLPGNTANRLAMAIGVVDTLASEVAVLRARRSWSDLGASARKHYVARWGSLAGRAKDYFQVVQRELEAAAEVAAPRPSGEELYGSWSDDD